MKVTLQCFDGAKTKARRLALKPLVAEVRDILSKTSVVLLEEKQKNGAAVIREWIDHEFAAAGDWHKTVSGGMDWKKTSQRARAQVAIGVEIQVSGRSEMLYRDLIHLRSSVVSGEIDLGVLVVPTDRMARYLTDRVSSKSYAEQVIKETDSDRYPLILIAVEHDGPGPAIEKRITNRGTGRKR